MNTKPTEQEINDELFIELSDPKLLHNLYHRDLSKMSHDELFEFYKMVYTVSKLKLFGQA